MSRLVHEAKLAMAPRPSKPHGAQTARRPNAGPPRFVNRKRSIIVVFAGPLSSRGQWRRTRTFTRNAQGRSSTRYHAHEFVPSIGDSRLQERRSERCFQERLSCRLTGAQLLTTLSRGTSE